MCYGRWLIWLKVDVPVEVDGFSGRRFFQWKMVDRVEDDWSSGRWFFQGKVVGSKEDSRAGRR
jgi:hypothetical protein